jgi:hypothetical protein
MKHFIAVALLLACSGVPAWARHSHPVTTHHAAQHPKPHHKVRHAKKHAASARRTTANHVEQALQNSSNLRPSSIPDAQLVSVAATLPQKFPLYPAHSSASTALTAKQVAGSPLSGTRPAYVSPAASDERSSFAAAQGIHAMPPRLPHAVSDSPSTFDSKQPATAKMVPAVYIPSPPMNPSSALNADRNQAEDAGDAVTLVYKDGRSEQIHNYLLSRTMLSVWDRDRDRRYRNIPLEQLNLEATEKTNREAGIDFALPGASE